jgi:BlaI family penicillinase repressor
MPRETTKPTRDQSGTPQPVPQISDAEWKVMKVVWERSPITAGEVVSRLEKKTVWKPKTIHTLLRRLVQKQALASEKQGREYQFYPRVNEQECVRAASQSFLRRFFEGELAPLFSCFLDQENLTPAEIEELKRMLDSKKS